MNKLVFVVAALAAVAGCKSRKHSKLDEITARADSLAIRAASADDPPPPEEEDKPSAAPTGAMMALDEGKLGKKDSDRAEGQYKMQQATGGANAHEKAAPKSPEARDAKHEGKDAGGGGDMGGEEAVTRAWFPETFLWNPLVVTDDQGKATVPVRVPDRLTTWHVLALAHARSGAQGGATAEFAGTLPAYVDVVVPPFLVVGDAIRLPIQIVNTTDHPITAPLEVVADRATLGPVGGLRTIPAGGNLVEYVTLEAKQPGAVKLKASIGTTDAVVRTFEVVPAGKPEEVHASGTLAAPRTLALTGPAGADPATDRARLVVYPGALALLRSELGVSGGRTGAADDAYLLQLAGRAPALLQALGDQADPEAIRTLAIIAGQKIVRDARDLQLDSALVIGEAALAHAGNPVLERLGARTLDYLANAQRPDGSFGGGQGWTLQRVLVTTADGARVVAGDRTSPAAIARGERVAARAAGMVARNLDRVADGYTAAAILASGTAQGDTAKQLHAKLTAAIKASADGAKYLEVPANTVRADGLAPNTAEATALAILALAPPGGPALAKEDAALVADLGATLLGSYSPLRGWGDGRANLLAMRAVVQLFKDPLPANVAIALSIDDKPVAQSQLDRTALRDALTLDAQVPTGVAGAHTWKITADPPVAGLAYSLAIQSYTPWPKAKVAQGLELALPETTAATVGKPVELAFAAVAPSGQPLHITAALPAGVQLDTPSVQKLVTDGVIERFDTSDGKLELFVPALAPGQTFAAKVRAIPTLAGTLHSAASQIEQDGHAFHVPPTTWIVKP